MKALYNSKTLPLRSLSALPHVLLGLRRYGCLSLKSVHVQDPVHALQLNPHLANLINFTTSV